MNLFETLCKIQETVTDRTSFVILRICGFYVGCEFYHIYVDIFMRLKKSIVVSKLRFLVSKAMQRNGYFLFLGVAEWLIQLQKHGKVTYYIPAIL